MEMEQESNNTRAARRHQTKTPLKCQLLSASKDEKLAWLGCIASYRIAHRRGGGGRSTQPNSTKLNQTQYTAQYQADGANGNRRDARSSLPPPSLPPSLPRGRTSPWGGRTEVRKEGRKFVVTSPPISSPQNWTGNEQPPSDPGHFEDDE